MKGMPKNILVDISKTLCGLSFSQLSLIHAYKILCQQLHFMLQYNNKGMAL